MYILCFKILYFFTEKKKFGNFVEEFDRRSRALATSLAVDEAALPELAVLASSAACRLLFPWSLSTHSGENCAAGDGEHHGNGKVACGALADEAVERWRWWCSRIRR